MSIKYHSCYDKLYFNCINPANNDGQLIKLSRNLTAHEVLIYTLILSKCIEMGTEKCNISYSELQVMRNKRKSIDSSTLKAYDYAFYGLMHNQVSYDISTLKRHRKITYSKYNHPLLLSYGVKNIRGNDKEITLSLGPFGKTLLESKMYSTLVPDNYFQVNFNSITSFLVALYICRIIFIERNKSNRKDSITFTLDSIMKGSTKYTISDDGMLMGNTSCYEYDGPNKLRVRKQIIECIQSVFEALKTSLKISNYKDIDLKQWKVYL